ncbi:unnamed protein product, partial [Musa hybrid cultivar]
KKKKKRRRKILVHHHHHHHNPSSLTVHHPGEIIKANEAVAVGVHPLDHAKAILQGAPVVPKRHEHAQQLLGRDFPVPVRVEHREGLAQLRLRLRGRRKLQLGPKRLQLLHGYAPVAGEADLRGDRRGLLRRERIGAEPPQNGLELPDHDLAVAVAVEDAEEVVDGEGKNGSRGGVEEGRGGGGLVGRGGGGGVVSEGAVAAVLGLLLVGLLGVRAEEGGHAQLHAFSPPHLTG